MTVNRYFGNEKMKNGEMKNYIIVSSNVLNAIKNAQMRVNGTDNGKNDEKK